MNQDFVAWVGQGTVADRTGEHLGESDRGVILMRRQMLEQAQVVAAGGEPKGVVRDAALNACIRLPIIQHDRKVNGYTLAEAMDPNHPEAPFLRPKEFVFQSGQPEPIRQAYRRAMGLDEEAQRAGTVED